MFARTLAVMACMIATLAPGVAAQILYGTTFTTPSLLTVDRADGNTLTTVGSLTEASGVNVCTGIAMNPLDGTMYVSYRTVTGSIWRLGTVNLASGAVTPIGTMTPMRDMTFDSSGTLWGVTGSLGAPAHALVTINTSTGATTTQNSSLPIVSNKIAYNTPDDELYLLGDDSGTIEMHRLSPGAPGSLTQVTLSGDNGSLVGTGASQPPLVYDPSLEHFVTNNAGNFFTITPAGVVTQINAPASIPTHGGLAFDQVTTSLPVALSEFRTD